MNTSKLIFALLASMTLMAGCAADDPYEDYVNNGSSSGSTSGSGGTGSGSGGSSSTVSGDLASFDVATGQVTVEPTDVASEYFPDEEDALENNDFATEVAIDMSNPVATTVGGVVVTVDGGHVTADHGSEKGICYVVSGSTSDGSLTIVGEKKYAVKLNGVSITNPDSAALDLLSSKRAYVVLAEGTTNTLVDGTGGSHKGALYCKGKLLFNGSGTLNVTGNTNNGIHTADYIVLRQGNVVNVKSTANHGIKANDGVFINGGIINVEVSAAAAKGINCESHIIVNGGSTTVVTTGGGAYDSDDGEAKGCAGVKSDSTLTVNGGELWLKSTGAGGKGISTDDGVTVTGGAVYVVTTGGQYASNGDTSSPKGIKADGNVSVSGGRIWVRTSGNGGEGIESKKEISISGGEVASYAYDDAINSKSTMTLSGGYVYGHGKNNDGIDANGNCYVTGGTVYAICSGQPEVAIDANTEGGYKLYVSGGTLVAVGGLENGSSLTQSCYQASTWSASTWYGLTTDAGTFAFKTPSSGGSGLVVSGSGQPSLASGVSVSGGTSYFGGLGVAGGSVSGGSSVSLSAYSGGNAMGGGGMGGGMGGRGGWH